MFHYGANYSKRDPDLKCEDEDEGSKIGQVLVNLWKLQNDNSSKEFQKRLLHSIIWAPKPMETRSRKNKVSFGEGGSQLREVGHHSPFYVGQMVRMLDDEPTCKAMQIYFGNKVSHLMAGQVGCVSKIEDGQNISLELLDTSLPALSATVQSNWIESLPDSDSQRYKTLFKLKWKLSDLLVEAAKEGDLYLVQLLFQNYLVPVEYVPHRSTSGLTALHVACQEGHLKVIQWLLSEPKNKDLLLEKEDCKGRRPIYFAVKGCQPETLNVLIKNGADVDPAQTSRGRKTPLHKAVIKMNLECVIILIDNYCNVNLKDSEGNTPLHYSVLDTSRQVNSTEVLKVLVKSERIDLNSRNLKGYNVFHLAVWAGNLSAVSYLLETVKSEMPLERVTDSGSNALHMACTKGNLEIAKLLLDKKEFVNGSDNNGQTPLMVACRKGFYTLIELLIEAGADVNSMDDSCDSAVSLMIRRIYHDDLHESNAKKTIFPSMEGSPEIYKIFIELSGLPCYKETMEKHPSIASVCYLIRHGGDLDAGRYWILKFRDVNIKAILEGFSSEWKMLGDGEQSIVQCVLCNRPASRMRFFCCGNESCLFCYACRTNNVIRCPCCNSLIKKNDCPLPVIVREDDDSSVMSDPSEPDIDSDSSPVNHQASEPKVNDNNLQLTNISATKSSEVFKELDVLPIIQVDTTNSAVEDIDSMPVTHISSPLPSSLEREPFRRSPKWILRKEASRKGTDLLEDGLGNYYTRRSANVWQCTRQSDKQRNKCPATVRIVGGQYTLSKSHRHSTQSTTIARTQCSTYQILK